MNKNELYKLIESEFKIIEKSFNELLICELSEIYYPEVTAKLTFSEDSNRFSIFSIEKGNEYLIFIFYCYLYIHIERESAWV